MQLKHIFSATAITAALVLAGCGGDINITPTVNDNSTDSSQVNSNNTTTTAPTPVEEVECASYQGSSGLIAGLKVGDDCLYNTSFAGANVQITENVTFNALPNGGVHKFDGALQIGADGQTDPSDSNAFVIPAVGPTMTVEAGATLAFSSGEAIVRIARGAKIQAVGTADAPITFTSAKAFDRFDTVGNGPQYADWGGIIINGLGITDQCEDAQRDAGTCNAPSEGIVSYYGGTDNADDSGALNFVKIWYAGSGPRTGGEGDDLNSLTLNAVGSRTSVDYIHIHQGFDDGIEIFGGAVNMKRVVVTDTQDDSFDFDAGWQGAAQFLFVQHGTVTLADGSVVNMGNGGFEQDGKKGTTTATAPSSFPDIANVTVITTDATSVRDEDDSLAMKFDDGFQANYLNVLVVDPASTNGDDTACFNFSTDGQNKVDGITFNNSVIACSNVFNGDATFTTDASEVPAALLGTAKADWFASSGTTEVLASGSDVLVAGIHTRTGAPITVTPATAAELTAVNPFFEAASFIGALPDTDTSSAWYNWVNTAVTAANAD